MGVRVVGRPLRHPAAPHLLWYLRSFPHDPMYPVVHLREELGGRQHPQRHPERTANDHLARRRRIRRAGDEQRYPQQHSRHSHGRRCLQFLHGAIRGEPERSAQRSSECRFHLPIRLRQHRFLSGPQFRRGRQYCILCSQRLTGQCQRHGRSSPLGNQPDHEPGRRAAQCAISLRSQFRTEQPAGCGTIFSGRSSLRLRAQCCR